MERPALPLTVDEVVQRLRAAGTEPPMADAQVWTPVEHNLALARAQAEIGGEPPLRPWQGALRPLARGAARTVLFLGRFITDAQMRFNRSIVGALSALVAGLRRLQSDNSATMQRTAARVRDLEQAVDQLRAELALLRGPSASTPTHLDELYAALEDRFRGPRDAIKARLHAYMALFDRLNIAASAQVLDVGCGRGEWLELLRERGLQARGIDRNAAMIARCRAQGLDVTHADVVDALAAISPASVDVVSALHLVEHLDFPALVAVLRQAARVLRPGGVLLLETPNPEHPETAARDFYLDPTHRHPLPPALLSFLVEAAEFAHIDVLSPAPHRSGGDYTVVARRP